MAHEYAVIVQTAQPRSIAAVRVRLPIRDVPRRFADFLNQVYAASRGGAIELDGQNIFIYSGDAHGEANVEFGVGTKRSFDPIGAVIHSATPSGEVATTTHWGDYANLAAARCGVGLVSIAAALYRGAAVGGVRSLERQSGDAEDRHFLPADG
jgi:hypothetical protein